MGTTNTFADKLRKMQKDLDVPMTTLLLLYDYVGEFDSEYFEDAYYGKWESKEEFSSYYAESIGLLDNVPDEIKRYFDWSAWTEDLLTSELIWLEDEGATEGHVFYI